MFKPKLKPFTNSNQENPDKANTKKKKIYKILIGIGILLVMALVIFLIVKIVSSESESDASVTDTFADETNIYSKTGLTVSGGQVRLTTIDACGGETTMQDASSTVYNIVAIGSQCWMAENLDYDNGCSSKGWVDESDTGWCGYYNGSSTDDTYGLLYQWSAAMNGTTTEGAQGICPAGWHLPTHDEYTTLERQICSDIGNSDCDTTFPYNTSTTGYLGDGEAPAMAASTTLWTDGLLVQDTTNFAPQPWPPAPPCGQMVFLYKILLILPLRVWMFSLPAIGTTSMAITTIAATTRAYGLLLRMVRMLGIGTCTTITRVSAGAAAIRPSDFPCVA